MRASGMDDVIFSGSGNRPARNTAEVGLYLDNSDRTAPAAFNDSDEIQVTRRIERENGSVYRINGKEARAKDVQLLFADASTGARSPSMVGQGRIGELIAAKPQARRQLLEEAAGISGLHSRRHEAELRLKGAETNLERLEDVTSQLESQIESLKRQSRQANRFKMLSADIRRHEAMLLHIRWVQAKEAEGEADSHLNQATSLVAEKAQAQMEAAKAQAIASLKLPELREAEARAAAALQRLQIAKSQLEEDAGRILRRRDELQRRLSQLREDIGREERMVADNAGILARLDEEESELADMLAEAGERAEEARERLADASERLSESERQLGLLTAEKAEAQASRNQLEKTIRDLGERQARLARQLSDQNRDLDELDRQIKTLPDPAEKQEEVEAAESALEQAENAVADIEEALAVARQTEAAARPSVDAARSQVNGIETEARTIRRMLEASAVQGAAPPVVDDMKVDRGFETALGAALGEDLESPLDPGAPAHWRTPGDASDDPQLPGDAIPLTAHVRAPQALDRGLRQIGIVENDATAERLLPLLKAGQRLVTRNGAVWRWDGHVTGADAPSAAALRLAQKNRLAELEGELADARDQLAAREAELAAAAARIRAEDERLRLSRETQRMVVRKLAEARDALAAAERASGDLVRRRAVLAETSSQLSLQVEEVGEQMEAGREALEEAPDVAGLEQKLNSQMTTVATDRALVAEARAINDGLARKRSARTPHPRHRGGTADLEHPGCECAGAYRDFARARKRGERGGRGTARSAR